MSQNNNGDKNDNALWNPHARMPVSTIVVERSSATLTKTDVSTEPSPIQDAARMAALKRLRHRLVKLCGANHKPPTLAIERWLARCALERERQQQQQGDSLSADVLLPSSGEADPGLIKDLSRHSVQNQARDIAQTLATESRLAAEKIAALTAPTAIDVKHGNQPKQWGKQLKSCTKAVKKASKAVQILLLTQSNLDDNDSLGVALSNLHMATKALEECRQGVQRWHEGCHVVLDTSRTVGMIDVALVQEDGTRKKPYLTIHVKHLHKLLQLWQLTSHPNDDHSLLYKHGLDRNLHVVSQKLVTMIESMSQKNLILKSLYCCLARYEAIKGAGYQCAVPPAAFDAASQQLGLGVTVECFASPLNCRYAHYFSAFPDIEQRFGSLGSFFDDEACFPIEGSFEANPPFVPEVMHAMNDKLDRILSNPKAKALSFLVVVPVWGVSGIGYVTQLEKSPYCRARARIPATDHSFCDGAQHKLRQQKEVLRPSSWDTAVVVWQNQAGAARWPVTSHQLETSVCTALRQSASHHTLRDWERRGIANGGKAIPIGRGNDESRQPSLKRARLG